MKFQEAVTWTSFYCVFDGVQIAKVTTDDNGAVATTAPISTLPSVRNGTGEICMQREVDGFNGNAVPITIVGGV